MSDNNELLRRVEEAFARGVPLDLLRTTSTDSRADGRTVTVAGRRLVNFGLCSYLGLETHPALVAAVAAAAERYGTQFASSRGYISTSLYPVAETALERVFGRPVTLFTSTTIGHLATVPMLVTENDALVLDSQAHESLRMASVYARAGGATVVTVPHNNMRALERRITELAGTHNRVWYAADGLYSMYGDFAPADAFNELVTRHEQLWLYVDDAHSVSWTGQYGRGHALDRLHPTTLARTVVTGSLNKSFAAAGGAVTFPDEASRDLVATLSGPSIFGGPLPPPMLAAVVASAELHQTPEVSRRQRLLLARIRRFNALAAANRLPLVTTDETPLRYVGTGPEVCWRLAVRLRDAGFFVNVADYPAVPTARAGIRLTLTLHHSDDDVESLVEAIADLLPRAVEDEGRADRAPD